MMKKRIISLLMALVMAVSLLPVSAFAEGEPPSEPTGDAVVETVGEGAAVETAGGTSEEDEQEVETQEDASDYELRVLTFEGDYWDALIDQQYGGKLLYGEGGSGMETPYTWADETTGLSHAFPKNNSYGPPYCYFSYGEAISHYNSGEIEKYGGYEQQLTVYKEGVTGIATTGGGHNGSDNFVVHYGYADTSGYGLGEDKLPRLTFTNGAHVIDHMYVKLTTYLLNCITNGNGLTASMGDDDIIYLRAIGYDADNQKVSEVKMNVCKGKNLIVQDWTKWDLSGLGAVSSVALELNGTSDNGYGFSQPAYFAYDDVAVRVGKSTEQPENPEQPQEPEACPPHKDEDENGFCDKCGEYLKEDTEKTDAIVAKLVIPEGATATFYASYDGTGKPIAAKDLGVDENNKMIHRYELTVPNGRYSCVVTDETHNYGGVGFEVPLQTSIYEETNLTLALVKYYTTSADIKTVNDFTLNLVAPGKANIIPGENYLDSTIKENKTYVVAPRMVWAYGNQILYNCTGELKGELSKTKGITPTGNVIFESTLTTVVNKTFNVTNLKAFTLTAPTDAETKFYNQLNNFNVVELTSDCIASQDNGDGTTTYTVSYSSFGSVTYRVTQEGYVTAAGYVGSKKEVTVTPRAGDSTSTETNIASKVGAGSNIEYENSVYLNIDDTKDTNELALQVGETFRLRAFRAAWEIVKDVTGNIMIEPDFNYRVLYGDDVVSVTPVTSQCTGNARGNWMDLQALKEGTALIAVWYDAIDVGGDTRLSGTYGATDPARYGYVLVNVGADHTVTWNPVSHDGDWDAEFDTAYYFGDHGTLTIAPEGATAVTVRNINGTTLGSVQTVTGANGKYDVPVASGSNLITVTTAGGTDYMLARAKKIQYTIENKTTGKTSADSDFVIRKGDELCVHFDQFNMPVAKMSGIYNPGYTGTAKTCYALNGKYALSSVGTQYDLITDAKSCITFKAMVVGENVLTEGYIQSGSMGDPFGNHRNITDAGRPANFAAVNVTGYFGSIEDIRFTVEDNAEAEFKYEDMVKLKKGSIAVGVNNYNNAGKFDKFTAVNNSVNWTKTNAQMNENYALRVNIEPNSYYTTLQMRYWYEGEEVHTTTLTAASETVIPWSEFAHDADKILNVQILVTPGDPDLGPTKVYSFLWLPGNSKLEYVHPVLRDLTITADGQAMEINSMAGKGIAFTETEYEIAVPESGTITLSGAQLQKYTNSSNNKQDNADTVTVQKMKNGAAVGEAIEVYPLTPERYPVGSWQLKDLDITDADSLEIKVVSYVDNATSRTYHVNFGHRYTDGKCSTCGAECVHVWDDGVVTTQPTAVKEGVKTFTCTVCQMTKTEAVAKLPKDAPVDAVIAKINGIGTVTRGSKAAIAAARAAYEALTDEQKAQIEDEVLAVLTEAEAAYEELVDTTGGHRRYPANSSAGTKADDAKSDAKTDGKNVKSGDTGDAGIALYAAMSLLSLTGGALVFSRKRKDD